MLLIKIVMNLVELWHGRKLLFNWLRFLSYSGSAQRLFLSSKCILIIILYLHCEICENVFFSSFETFMSEILLVLNF